MKKRICSLSILTITILLVFYCGGVNDTNSAASEIHAEVVPMAGAIKVLDNYINVSGKDDIMAEIQTESIEDAEDDDEGFIILSDKPKTMYVKVPTLKLKESPKKKSKTLGKLHLGDKIKIMRYKVDGKLNKKWCILYDENSDVLKYIEIKNLSKKSGARYYEIQPKSKFKSWMPYTAITLKSSAQYKLQHSAAYTGKYGVRMVDDRYCVAIGGRFKCTIGQYFDVILKNGRVIRCIKGDEKANCDTDSSNTYTTGSGCSTEFIVDSSALIRKVKNSGSLSSVKGWDSAVCGIKVYEQHH